MSQEFQVIMLILAGAGALTQGLIFFLIKDICKRIERLDDIFIGGCRFPPSSGSMESHGES